MLENIGEFEGSILDIFIPKYEVVILFGFVNKIQFSEAKEDDFYIKVCTNYSYYNSKPVEVYRISLDEPKYIYGSDRLPEDIKDVVVNCITDNYVRGIKDINKYAEEDEDFHPYDINRPIPDYKLL